MYGSQVNLFLLGGVDEECIVKKAHLLLSNSLFNLTKVSYVQSFVRLRS